jgi:hypothetical protein
MFIMIVIVIIIHPEIAADVRWAWFSIVLGSLEVLRPRWLDEALASWSWGSSVFKYRATDTKD